MHLVIDDAYHDVMTPFDETFHSGITHAAGDQPVHTRGRPTALDMPEDTNAGIGRGDTFLDHLGNVFRAPVTFGYNDDIYQFFASFFFKQRIDQLFDIRFAFGNEDILGPRGNAAVQGDIPGVTAHHLDDEQPVMRI